MNKVLVTGANGLIGHELLQLLPNKSDVYALVRKIPDKHVGKVNYVETDLSSAIDTASFPKNIETIVHLAQSEKFRDFPDQALDVFQVNTSATINLLDYAHKNKVKKFIYASSGGIYGNRELGFKEEEPLVSDGDLGFYLSTKLSAELLVQSYCNVLDILILRFFFVYGSRQRRSMLIPRLVDNVRNGNEIILQGEEGMKINPIHVSDAARAVMAGFSLKGSHKINVAGPQELSFKAICDAISIKVSQKPNYKVVDGNPNNLLGDITKMRSMLHDPKIKFSEGVEDLL